MTDINELASEISKYNWRHGWIPLTDLARRIARKKGIDTKPGRMSEADYHKAKAYQAARNASRNAGKAKPGATRKFAPGEAEAHLAARNAQRNAGRAKAGPTRTFAETYGKMTTAQLEEQRGLISNKGSMGRVMTQSDHARLAEINRQLARRKK